LQAKNDKPAQLFLLTFPPLALGSVTKGDDMTKLEQWMRTQVPKMTDQRLADLVGATRPTISGIKKGHTTPTLAVAVRLMKATGLKASDFLAGAE
jgi:DNA-binding XRE family transcriptional regulator